MKRDISTLHNWDKNPRSITKNGLERLKKQIQKLGQYKPLLITEDGTVLGGNMRLKAYQELGIKDIWVSVVDAPTEEKKIEYALSDNDRVGKYEGDQMADLIGNFPEVDWGDYSIDLKEPELVSELMDKFSETEEDEAPAVQEGEAESKLGEVYQLGRHRLMCGDSTDAGTVAILMNGQKADMVFTDPPYGVDIGDKSGRDILGDGSIEEMGKIVQKAFINLSSSIKDGAGYYVCSPQGGDMELMMMMMRDAGIKCRHQIIWKKDAPVFSMGRLDYDYMHEPILYGWKKSHQFYSKNERSVWEIARPKSSKLHPTMKPIELCAKAIKNSSKDGDIVIDLFGGSGSTLIACEQTNRTCYMMELDPHYCDVIRKRYENFVNKKQKITNEQS